MNRASLGLVLVSVLGCAGGPRPASGANTAASATTVSTRTAAGGDDVHREGRAARSTAPDPGAGHHASDLAGRLPDVRESRALGPLMAAAEQVRGLRFLRPVPTRIQTRAEITEFVRAHIDRDELEQARVFYLALGLLPPTLDVHGMLLSVMGEQIVGYYDPSDRVMVVRDDVVVDLARADPSRSTQSEGGLVLVHEYVHALQDQHLGLHESEEAERSIDGDNAFASLVEGDATLAMVGFTMGTQGLSLSSLTRTPAMMRRVIASAPGVGGGPELAAAPAIVRAPLLSRYLDGFVFCGTLHGRGGYAGVDAAFRRPPESTEQVLHPERYLDGERPERVSIPPFDELAAAGLTVHDENTLGELELSVYLAQGGADDRAAAAAEGWAGDTLRVYRRPDGATAALWFIAWDTAAEALEAEDVATHVLHRLPVARQPEHRVARSGRALLVVRDLDPALHAAVLDDFEAFAAHLGERPRILD